MVVHKRGYRMRQTRGRGYHPLLADTGEGEDDQVGDTAVVCRYDDGLGEEIRQVHGHHGEEGGLTRSIDSSKCDSCFLIVTSSDWTI